VGSALVASFAFDLKRDATFDYNPEFDSSRAGFLSGMGTSKLTFLGYPLTVDTGPGMIASPVRTRWKRLLSQESKLQKNPTI
jgi:hypothetical protein